MTEVTKEQKLKLYKKELQNTMYNIRMEQERKEHLLKLIKELEK